MRRRVELMAEEKPPVCAATSIPHRVTAIAWSSLLLLISACASHPTPRVSEASIREFAAKGYAAAEHDSVSTTSHAWTVSGRGVKIVLAEPVRPGPSPVVIYLPGLGESSEAGEQWRTAWASAGYAVVSVQLLDDDATAWKSEFARAGDFKALGHQRYAGTVMSRRVQLLADLVSEGRRRSIAGEVAWQRLDWTKVALAGFDLGAYTAMTVAGEHVRDADDAAGRLQVSAVIALSPFANPAAGSFDTRYRDIRVPVTSVASDVDGDALGLVDSAYLREAPFTHMEGSNKYLLSLQGLPHAGFSGSPDAKGLKAEAEPTKRAQDTDSKASSDGSGQHRHGGRRGGSGDGGKPGRARPEASGDEGAASAGLSPSALQIRLIAAQDVSTAFLDAYVKDDALAREWLAVDAKRWLGTSGELRRK
jgi:predicted dienelactone hydrolase